MIRPCRLHKAKIKDDKTYMVISVEGDALQEIKTDNGVVFGELRIDDNRRISAEQRRKVYATIRDMAEFTGDNPEFFKELMKYSFISVTGCKEFSLSDVDVTLARKFISYLIEFAFEWDIPLKQSGIDRTDDVGRYLYACLKFKKCCICGLPADTHHVDAIGMGNDRKTIDDSNHRKVALCREHHQEAHNKGWEYYSKLHKIYGIIFDEMEDLKYWEESECM